LSIEDCKKVPAMGDPEIFNLYIFNLNI
jgi:hypothetical protein